MLDRKFNAAGPNQVWASDITYVWTLGGWHYLAVVMDLFSRQIVGWAMDRRIKRKLTLDALAMAYWRRKPTTLGYQSPMQYEKEQYLKVA